MKSFSKVLMFLTIVSLPLTISGCGVKGDPLVPVAAS